MVLPEMIRSSYLSVTEIIKTEKDINGDIVFTLVSNRKLTLVRSSFDPIVAADFQSQLKELLDWILDDIKQDDDDRFFTELSHQLGVPEDKIEELFAQVLNGTYTSA